MSSMVPRGELPAEHGALLGDLRALIRVARERVAHAADSALTLTYWRLGKQLTEEDLAGGRGEYGRGILATLSQELEAELGAGFSYCSFTRLVWSTELSPDSAIVASVTQQSTWTQTSNRVAEYLTELPPPEVLRDRLHRAILAARERAVLPAAPRGDA